MKQDGSRSTGPTTHLLPGPLSAASGVTPPNACPGLGTLSGPARSILPDPRLCP